MSNGQGSFAVSPTYSPRFSPPSPGSMAANSDTRPVQAHSELQPYDSEGYIRPNHFSIAPVAAVLSQSHQPRDHVVSILNPQSPAPASPVMAPTVPSMAPRYAHAPPHGICYSCHHPAHTGSEVCPNDQGLPEQHAIPSNPPRRRCPRHAPPRIHRPVTASPAGINPGLLLPSSVPGVEKPRRSPLWKRPTLNVSPFKRLMQYIEMATSFSTTYTDMSPHFNLRLRQHREARRDDNRSRSHVEVYFNELRDAELPKPVINLLLAQYEMEQRNQLPHTRIPGAALVMDHLGVTELPDHIACLHDPESSYAEWEPFRRIMYEIISNNSDLLAIKHILIMDDTPLHLQVIPHSNGYSTHINDLAIRFHTATRQLMEEIMNEMLLQLRTYSVGQQIGDTFTVERHIRERWAANNQLPTIFLESKALPRIYPVDHVAYNTGHHPFIHKFELDFMENGAKELAHELRDVHTDPYRRLYDSIRSLIYMESAHQADLSRLFLSGVFAKIPHIDIFEPEPTAYMRSTDSRPMTPEGMGISELGS
ncbi:hypothetical protein B0H16DRAFT_1744289 [Mycena metata]|uniref:Uncharacterized protein n=1 Tax=Mycena metata TaxID=1033252 RepID=A0AAD7H574_9AGAR|nr:hypothetical protein B0H16DRAFT_1744289 [Mycena metata]